MNLTAIIIVAIVAGMIVSIIIAVKKSPNTKYAEEQFAKHEQSVEQQLADMKARIETLEKIVTDEKYSLNREFENLKD
ncbi:hypothetical protein PN836_007095 [Ningiella sp. W23]|uniref:hypothetical protein n=1 Tax=Ningiella sp. W23 TaxID=3023715 RepID=UPI0037577A55